MTRLPNPARIRVRKMRAACFCPAGFAMRLRSQEFARQLLLVHIAVGRADHAVDDVAVHAFDFRSCTTRMRPNFSFSLRKRE